MSYAERIREAAAACHQDSAFIIGIAIALDETGLASMCGFGPRVKPKEGPPPPFPLPHEITAIQTSLFDNWPQGRPVKGIPSRFGMAVEVWTLPSDKIVIQKGRKPNYQFKAQMALMDSANLKRQIADVRRKKRKAPVSPDYLDTLDALAEAMKGTDYRVGMLNTNITDDKSGYDKGRYYHSNQLILVEMNDKTVTSCKLILGRDDEHLIVLPPFADKDAGGNPLARNVLAQSRDDRCKMTQSSWATNRC